MPTTINHRCNVLVLAVVGGIVLVFAAGIQADTATGSRYVVATGHPLATDVARGVFEDGGNAVDAAVAAALALGVVDSAMSGIGGGCFILIRTADGELIAVDGRETAPAAATKNMYLKDGKPDGDKSQVGPLAVATPGALAAYDLALTKCGSKSLATVLQPGIALAEDGFVLGKTNAEHIAIERDLLARYPATARVFLDSNGTARQATDILKQPDLAKTYREIATHGTDWFYNGPFAERVGAWMKTNGGILTKQDFADYRPRIRRPVVSTYRGHKIVGFPPPSSGGVHVAQILNILETFDVAEVAAKDQATFIHLTTEAMKRAFADRAYWLGDTEFAKVPRGLIDKSYAKELAAQIVRHKATQVEKHGTPPRAAADLFDHHTTHIAAADAAGNWVAITATINLRFGSKVIVPGTGVLLNNEMDDFSIQPRVPNAFGLVGAEANAIAPSKRPLSSMSPTIVLKDGNPILSVGAAGGPRIITQAMLTIIHQVDRKLDLPTAVAQTRFHHQWRPDQLFLEKPLFEKYGKRLESLGHSVADLEFAGVTQAVGVAADGRTLIGVADPRYGGKATGR